MASFTNQGVYGFVSAVGTNAQVIKAATGSVFGFHIANTTAAWKYVRLYNKATAPTPGGDLTLLVYRIGVPPNSVSMLPFDEPASFFSAGIGVTATGGSADSDTTALAVGDVVVNIFYA